MIMNDNLGLKCENAVYSAVGDDYSWGPGIRREYIIHYIKKGSGYFECEGRKYHINKGQCFFIFPDTLIKYYPDKKDPWEYAWIDLTGEEIAEMLKYTVINPGNPVTEKSDINFAVLFKNTADAMKYKSLAAYCSVKSEVYSLLSYLFSQCSLQKEALKTDNTVRTAEKYIENNYRRHQLNVDMISKELNINRTSLYRRFINETGVSPKEYITGIRISKASEMLRNSSYSIKSIAYSVGFEDQMYFSKVFRRTTGMTPKEFRSGCDYKK